MTVTAPPRGDAGDARAEATGPQLALPSAEGPAATGLSAGRGTTVLGVLLLMAADAMALGTLLAAYFAIKGGAASWPPKGVKLGTYLPTTVTITAIMSAITAGWALYAIRRNDQRNAATAMALTVFFGVAMANAQWYSLSRASFSPASHAYGTLYHLLIGYHIAHVVVGVAMLIVTACRALAGHFRVDAHEPVQATVYFWQFGNVVWLSILIAFFLVSRHAG